MEEKVIERGIEIRDTGVKVGRILGLIAQGYAYDRILKALPDLTMGDIMGAAELARQVVEELEDENGRVQVRGRVQFVFSYGKVVLIESVRREYPRAYKPWTEREDNSLADAFKRGVRIEALVKQHRRQPGAIQARLEKLGLSRR